MKRYILTGAPGAGKTTMIRALEVKGYAVVEEAATDIIALGQALGEKEPWKSEKFIDQVIQLQRQRQLISPPADTIFFDRSPFCTYALANYLNYPLSPLLLEEIERIKSEEIYQKTVFFIQNIGFCTPTKTRKISFEESLRFEKIHEEVYRYFGFNCVKIKSDFIEQRVNKILDIVNAETVK